MAMSSLETEAETHLRRSREGRCRWACCPPSGWWRWCWTGPRCPAGEFPACRTVGSPADLPPGPSCSNPRSDKPCICLLRPPGCWRADSTWADSSSSHSSARSRPWWCPPRRAYRGGRACPPLGTLESFRSGNCADRGSWLWRPWTPPGSRWRGWARNISVVPRAAGCPQFSTDPPVPSSRQWGSAWWEASSRSPRGGGDTCTAPCRWDRSRLSRSQSRSTCTPPGLAGGGGSSRWCRRAGEQPPARSTPAEVGTF